MRAREREREQLQQSSEESLPLYFETLNRHVPTSMPGTTMTARNVASPFALTLPPVAQHDDHVHAYVADDHMLAAMFRSPWRSQLDEQQEYFIDRDPTHFRYILNYLRCVSEFNRSRRSCIRQQAQARAPLLSGRDDHDVESLEGLADADDDVEVSEDDDDDDDDAFLDEEELTALLVDRCVLPQHHHERLELLAEANFFRLDGLVRILSLFCAPQLN